MIYLMYRVKLSSSFSEMSIQNISNTACRGYQSVELSRQCNNWINKSFDFTCMVLFWEYPQRHSRYTNFIIKTKVLLPQLYLIVAGCASGIVLNYLPLKSFGFEVHDECYFRHVRTKFDIYVFITMTGPIPLLVD